METGRKFWLCMLGIGAAMIRPDSAGEVAAIVIAFCGGNAAISVAHAKSNTTETKTEEKIIRNIEEGYEPTP